MSTTIEAVFEKGVFRPLTPLNLPEGQQVQVVIAEDGIVKADIPSSPARTAGNSAKAAEDLSEEDFEACLDSLAEGLDKLPVLRGSNLP